MASELTRDDVLSGIDNSQNSDTISPSEDNGRDLSQDNDISALEIPDNFRQQYKIPENYKTMDDVFKGLQGQLDMHGRQSNEVGELRQQNQQISQQMQQLMQRFNGIQNSIGGKTPEQQQAEFLDLLTKDPRQGIQSAAMEAFTQQINPLLGTINEMRDWQKKMEITNDKSEFIRQNNLTPEDENELADIISKDQDFYKTLPSTTHILKAARAELINRRSIASSKDTASKQAENISSTKRAQVLSNTNSRPANSTGTKSLEELREEIMSKIPRV